MANWSDEYEVVVEYVNKCRICCLRLQLLQLTLVEQAQQLIVDHFGMIGQPCIAVDFISLIELLQLVEKDDFVGRQLESDRVLRDTATGWQIESTQNSLLLVIIEAVVGEVHSLEGRAACNDRQQVLESVLCDNFRLLFSGSFGLTRCPFFFLGLFRFLVRRCICFPFLFATRVLAPCNRMETPAGVQSQAQVHSPQIQMSQFSVILVNEDGEVVQDKPVCPLLLAAELVSVKVNIVERRVLCQCFADLEQVS